MKKLKKNGIILALITLIVLFLVLKDDFGSIIKLLYGSNPLFILIACLLQFLLIFFESLAFHQILKSYKEDYHFKSTYQLSVITKFFNGITPFSTGGQPMQVYYLNKDGFRITKATNAIMQNFILYQVSLITVGTLSLLLNQKYNYFMDSPILRKLVTLGFLVNTLVMIFVFIISFSNKFNQFFIEHGINFLTSLGLIKDKEKTKERWIERCNDFHQGATFIKEHKKLCIQGYCYNIIALLCHYAIAYFVAKALSMDASVLLIPSIVASSYVAIIGSFVPIPGASGGIEFGFLQFFGNFISGSLLSATLLVWRSITYYIPMILGAVVLNLRKDD